MIFKDNIYKFSSFPDSIVHGISTRYFGSIKDKSGFYKDNLKKFTDYLGIYPENIVFPNQKHTGNIRIISKNSALLNSLEIDGLVTKEKGIFLGIVTADCLPVMFFDPKQQIAGVAHAGYKGILNGILENMILTFIQLGSEVKNIVVGIGPGIGICCFSVPRERVTLFVDAYPECKDIYQKRGEEFFLDLVSVAECALIKQGIRPSQIEKANICTKDNINKFYSYRRDTPESYGEFASIIGIRQ